MIKGSIFTLLGILLLNGCTGTEAMPGNATQTGAVTGALAGSVIGYNTKGHHKGERAVIGGLIGAAAGAAVGNAVESNTPPPEDTSGWHE
jgi:uncharacterized protein YcfJ